jgi:hypothetical protein
MVLGILFFSLLFCSDEQRKPQVSTISASTGFIPQL